MNFAIPPKLARLRQPRTATLLLLALAAAAATATAIPQQPVSPRTVAAWREGTEGPGRRAAQILDALGLFDITGSWWWTLLVVVITAASCWWLVSGGLAVARQWRRPPPRRAFPSAVTAGSRHRLAASPAALIPAVHAELRRRGYRVWVDGTTAVVGERGRWRGLATLLSHAAVPLLLLGLVAAQAFAFTGQVDLVEGERVVDAPVSYGRVRHGPLWRHGDHPGFVLALDDFAATFHADGTPDDFVARVRIDDGPPSTVRINHPLRTHGMMISLLRYGVAPRVVVRDRAGAVRHDAAVRLSEADRTWAGSTLVHAGGSYLLDMALVSANGRDDQGAVPDDPVLLVDVFAATPSGGRGALLDQVAVPLHGTVTALGGAVEIGMPRLAMWAGFQVSHPAGRRLLLAGAGLLLVGLALTLWWPRRRVWIELNEAHDTTTVHVTAAASDAAEAQHEHTTLAGAIRTHVEGNR